MANIETKQEQVDVVDNEGKMTSREGVLSDIFDKIQEGKESGKSTEEVLGRPDPTPVEKKEPSKTESLTEPTKTKVVETKEVKVEEKTPENKSRDDFIKDIEASRPQEKKVDPKLEDKKEDKKEDKPEAKLPDVKEDPITEDELKPLPHDKPRTVKRIQELLKRIETVQGQETTTKKELEARDLKLKGLEEELGKAKSVDPRTQEEIKKQVDELAMYRRRYDLEKDPEVKTKFDSRIDQSEGIIITTLKANAASQPLLDLIKEEGGWNKFAASQRAITLSDNRVVTAAQLAEDITQRLPLAQRREIDSAMMEQIQLTRDKNRYFKEQQENASKFFQEREAQASQAQEVNTKRQKEVQDNVKKWYEDTVSNTPWLHEQEIPEKSTKEERTALEEDNKYTKQLVQLFQKSLATSDVKEALGIVADSIRYYQERRVSAKLVLENEKLRKQLEAKDGDIAKIKGAARSTPRAGTISPASSSESTTTKPPKSLEDAFEAIARGEELPTI